jgi:peptidoglycan/xylan/chitin deacetylase (PgdA/CDA1 family)
VGRSNSSGKASRLLVCFDFEGSYGMPHDAPYDIEDGARRILGMLARYQASATFFVVGRLIEEHPRIIHALADAGHEIGLHGYDHDNLATYDTQRLAQFDDDLARVESRLHEITGVAPRCFRAPYLLSPHFYRSEISAILKTHGYRWVSNREVRYPIELLRPDRLPINNAWRRRSTGSPRLTNCSLMLAPLNAGLVLRETFGASSTERLQWLLGDRRPFWRDGLVEVPLYAPLDCDLLGLPTPQCDTQPKMLTYAQAVVKAAAIAALGTLSMVTFHDWIVSGGNRLVLLNDALAAARDAGTDISTVAANPDWLPKGAGQPNSQADVAS